MMDHFKGLRGEKIFVQFFKKKITGFCLIKYEKKYCKNRFNLH